MTATPVTDKTTLPAETRDLIDSALFHFWNCTGGCGKLHHAMAQLAAHVGYESYPDQAEQIASYVGRDVHIVMDVIND